MSSRSILNSKKVHGRRNGAEHCNKCLFGFFNRRLAIIRQSFRIFGIHKKSTGVPLLELTKNQPQENSISNLVVSITLAQTSWQYFLLESFNIGIKLVESEFPSQWTKHEYTMVSPMSTEYKTKKSRLSTTANARHDFWFSEKVSSSLSVTNFFVPRRGCCTENCPSSVGLPFLSSFDLSVIRGGNLRLGRKTETALEDKKARQKRGTSVLFEWTAVVSMDATTVKNDSTIRIIKISASFGKSSFPVGGSTSETTISSTTKARKTVSPVDTFHPRWRARKTWGSWAEWVAGWAWRWGWDKMWGFSSDAGWWALLPLTGKHRTV